MKIKLKMSRVEMQGIAALVQNCCNALSGVEFNEVQYRDALAGLTLKLAARMPTLKRRNTLALSDIEALALWDVLNEVVDRMPPLEMAVGYKIIGEIDQQRESYVSLMRGNLYRIQEQQKQIGY